MSDDFFVEGGFQASGTKNFVQNHPRDEALSIVYTALEGDEPATFTRGTARLDNGVARVQLGETFAWVTNPDVGLTAHLTPRGPATVWVESLTPHELVVRADAESTDVRFDYVVLGLRLGYEEHSVLVERTTPAPLPSRESFERYYAAHPERRAGAPLARHVAMLEAVGENAPETLAADELVRMAGTFEPDLPSPVVHSPEGVRRANIPGGVPDARIGSGRPTDEHRVAKERRASLALDSRVIEDDTLWLPVSSPVEQGDVLALSATESDLFAPASSIADAGVVGIAAGRSRVDDDGRLVAPMAGSVYAVVKADAGFGAIWPGDLLVSSPTPGHAMRAVEVSVGTVIGKAIDRLETGTGTIRVLVTAR